MILISQHGLMEKGNFIWRKRKENQRKENKEERAREVGKN